MKKEDLATRFKSIGELGSVEEMRTEMSKFLGELEADYDSHNQVLTENQDLKDRNVKLTEYNMSLYQQTIKRDPEPEKKKEVNQELTYENLYDENGGLK